MIVLIQLLRKKTSDSEAPSAVLQSAEPDQRLAGYLGHNDIRFRMPVSDAHMSGSLFSAARHVLMQVSGHSRAFEPGFDKAFGILKYGSFKVRFRVSKSLGRANLADR